MFINVHCLFIFSTFNKYNTVFISILILILNNSNIQMEHLINSTNDKIWEQMCFP